MKKLKTKIEMNDYFRSQLGKGEIVNGELNDSQMNEFLRSRGEVPEKKAPPNRVLTPEQVVEVLEIMSANCMTYSQAKAKFLTEADKKAAANKNMNDYIRAQVGKSSTNISEEETKK